MSRVGDFSLGAGVESAIARVLEAAGRSGTRGDRVARLLDASTPAQLPYGLEVRTDVADPIVQEGPSPRTWHLGLSSLVEARPDDSGAPFCFAVSRSPAPRHLGSYELSGVCSRDERHLVVPPRDARSRDRSLPVLPLHRARVALPAALTDLFAVGEALDATDELRGVFALIQGEADGAVVVGARNPWTLLGAVLVARARGYVLLSSDGTPVETVSDLRSPFVIASSHLLAHQYEGLIEKSQLRGKGSKKRGRKGAARR